MSVLVELQERVQKTNALIAQYEGVIATAGVLPPPSVVTSVRSLEKLKRRLEAEFEATAQSLEMEVYRYRLLTDDKRATLSGVAEAWAKFQVFFGSVYSALMRSPKAKGKKPPQSQNHLELGYGYSFAGSIGVVVTVPREIGIYAVTPIEEASATVFDLIEAKNVGDIAARLGPAPIQALHEWIDVHVENHYGLGLEWRSGQATKRIVEAQYQSLIQLRGKIADTTTTVGIDVKGLLFAVNDKTKSFKLSGDNGQEYEGQFGAAITTEHAASVPARYTARIIETTQIIVLGEEPRTTFFLERLESL
jgi:hypothetical protein